MFARHCRNTSQCAKLHLTNKRYCSYAHLFILLSVVIVALPCLCVSWLRMARWNVASTTAWSARLLERREVVAAPASMRQFFEASSSTISACIQCCCTSATTSRTSTDRHGLPRTACRRALRRSSFPLSASRAPLDRSELPDLQSTSSRLMI